MSSGRGGAGNILAVQQEKARVTSDVEANLQTAESAPAPQLANTQEYAHSGRGGAGNYYSPKDLKDIGHFSNENPIVPPTGQTQTKTDLPVMKYGRGGAGNVSYGVNEERAASKRIEDERTKRERIQAESERQAESIAMPPKAKLPLQDNDSIEPF